MSTNKIIRGFALSALSLNAACSTVDSRSRVAVHPQMEQGPLGGELLRAQDECARRTKIDVANQNAVTAATGAALGGGAGAGIGLLATGGARYPGSAGTVVGAGLVGAALGVAAVANQMEARTQAAQYQQDMNFTTCVKMWNVYVQTDKGMMATQPFKDAVMGPQPRPTPTTVVIQAPPPTVVYQPAPTVIYQQAPGYVQSGYPAYRYN